MFSECRVLGAKEPGGDGPAVRNWSFAVKIHRQDVGVELLHVAVQLVAVNEHLRGGMKKNGVKKKKKADACVQGVPAPAACSS